MSKNKSYVAMDKFSLRRLKHTLSEVIPDCGEYVFIDLGCGEGSALVKHRNLFQRCIGVENNRHSYQMCRLKTSRYSNIEVILGGLETYHFDNVDTVLFMYDPLWLLTASEAEGMYRQCLSRLKQSITGDHQVYVACSMTGQNKPAVDRILAELGFKRLVIQDLERYQIKLYHFDSYV